MPAEYQLSLNDYLSILRRRAVVIGVSFAVTLAIAVVVAVAIPPVYRSTGVIMVESQQIPTEMVPTSATSFVDERIEVIRQRVMTRENLARIIDKYKLFRERRANLTVTEKVDEVREHILIEPIVVASRSRRPGQGVIAFKLIYEDRRPETAHKVANELVTLFLDENVKARTSRAAETTEFLAQEANKLKAELESVEGKLAAYRQEHGNALPEHQPMRMNMIARTENDLRNAERDHKAAQEELRYLEVELNAARSGINLKTGASNALPVEELAKLKADYERMLDTYKESHPDMKALKRKIDVLEVDAPAESKKAGGTAISLDVAKTQARYAAAQGRVDSLASQVASLRAKLAATERQIIQSPQVERGLVSLTRDHDSAQKKYEEVRAKFMNAKMAESLEGENKAERFSLLEPPIYPESPSKPDRVKILLIGFLASLASSGGLVFLLEKLNARLRGEEALSLAAGQRVMLVIPYIRTAEETAARRQLVIRRVATAIGVLVAAFALVHFLYMPLDVLLAKVIARFG